VLAARRGRSPAILSGELAKQERRATAIDLDVHLVDRSSRARGGGPIDILVNNAGISIVKPASRCRRRMGRRGRHQPARRLADGAGRGQALGGGQAAGVIVNIGSILGLRTIGQVAPYNASKAGLIHLTRVLAMEWARYDIRVNAICPATSRPEMNSAFWKTPGGQTPDRAYPAAAHRPARAFGRRLLLLASDAGQFMTGSVVTSTAAHTVSSL
jgi:NAD(P)-dependent dehydrogenase (short-subunit alcohol dehydrogenase family)